MVRKLLLFLATCSANLFAMESMEVTSSVGKRKREETESFGPWKKQDIAETKYFPLERLSEDTLYEVGKNVYSISKQNFAQNKPKAVLDSYKKFLNFSRVNKGLRNRLTKAYKTYIGLQLKPDDFADLNSYVFEVVQKEKFFQDAKKMRKIERSTFISKEIKELPALIRFLKTVDKLDPIFRNKEGDNLLTVAIKANLPEVVAEINPKFVSRKSEK